MTRAKKKVAPKPVKRTKKETRGQRNIRFIEEFCVIPEGEDVGKPVRLTPEQKKFILAIYDNKFVTDTAILSMARKNAKTALAALLVILHIVGPEAIKNSRILSGAMSREQASEVYNLASKCIALSDDLRDLCNVIPSTKTIQGLPYNVEYKAISADASTAHGKSPVVAILDEVGQIRGANSDFVNAITSAQGAYKEPLVIYISTQAPNDADFFSLLIDDARKNKPPKTVCFVYEAPKDCELMDEKAWRAANPGVGYFRSIDDIRKQAEAAKRMPSLEASFRNLILNQRVEVKSAFVSQTVWKENGGAPKPIKELKKLHAALDLSAKFDLTAFMLKGVDDEGITHVHTYAWTPGDGVIDRARRDRVPYDLWVRDGLLRTTPGKSVDYEYIAKELREILEDVELLTLQFDRWNIEFFRNACDKVGVVLPLVEHGQGFKSMAPALDALEAELLNGRMRHGMHPVLTMCAGNAVVTSDPAGGRKLDKSKATGRIDCMVALAMSMTGSLGEVEKEPPEYQIMFI